MIHSIKEKWGHLHLFPAKANRQKAFTLIELMVVIAILAILAALVWGLSGSVMEKANVVKTTAKLRAIGVAINIYAGDNDGSLPGPMCVAIYKHTTVNTTPGATLAHLGAYLAPYLERRQVDWMPSNHVYLPELDCDALPTDVRKNLLIPGFVRLDYPATSEDNIFGGYPPIASMGVAAQTTPKPKRVAALSEKQRRSAIVSTVDQEAWVSPSNGPLPATGIFSGKRLYLFLDGSVVGPIEKPPGTWVR